MRTLFRNAQFWSAGEEIFDAILVENDLIIATGEIALHASHDKSIDLNGAFVMPAFLDGHAHPIFAGREAAGPKINGLDTVELILNAVEKFAQENPDTPWIIGGAYEAAIIQ